VRALRRRGVAHRIRTRNVSRARYRPAVDVETSLDGAEIEAPGRRGTAAAVLAAQAARIGMPLDAGNVALRRAEGIPEVHITAAVGKLLEHLVARGMRSMRTARSWSWRGPVRGRC
jgi:hypothetical protein